MHGARQRDDMNENDKVLWGLVLFGFVWGIILGVAIGAMLFLI